MDGTRLDQERKITGRQQMDGDGRSLGGIASTVLHIIGYVLYVMLGMLSAMSSPYDY